ncbi:MULTISPECIES: LysR family transcriptional regulator [unclassified Brenneria]|uniref:LysR family transcriptional regulator n=1 Tax=unclassified Brenneria TaxID=2634434 RepID=UPI0018F07F51|nr:LysR family transcriptional regulator [Brenneria sp. L3-3C-1]MBJ7223618.1 LysR family transcriptional regulator [Brenneria sp. L3-3C-1]MEE3644860.1 LysR family transcriptional regulator [Brenneria sp. L3_3C_1]
MRIRHLQYFLVVAEEQSFARAAARVHIEPSPLSRTIRDLETQLGVQLLHRSKGRIRLTWPGEVFREEVRRILAVIESAQTRVHSASQGYIGRLRIGLADSLAQPRLTQLLARCREEEPRTEVRISEMTVNEMLQALSHDQIDVGFTVDDATSPGYRKEAVWAERPAIAIPRNHPLLSLEKVPIAEVLRYPLVLCHPERCAGGYNVIRRWFGEPSLSLPRIAEYVSGHEPMIMLVAAGYGVGIGLASQIALYSHPEVIIREVVDDIPNTATFIVTTEKERSPELERFIDRAFIIGGMPGTK